VLAAASAVPAFHHLECAPLQLVVLHARVACGADLTRIGGRGEEGGGWGEGVWGAAAGGARRRPMKTGGCRVIDE
jgi:hypothetical protein